MLVSESPLVTERLEALRCSALATAVFHQVEVDIDPYRARIVPRGLAERKHAAAHISQQPS